MSKEQDNIHPFIKRCENCGNVLGDSIYPSEYGEESWDLTGCDKDVPGWTQYIEDAENCPSYKKEN